MKKILILGDIHGLYRQMECGIHHIINEFNDGKAFDKIIQVGDFGFYPNNTDDKEYYSSFQGYVYKGIPKDELPSCRFADRMFFIRGNHEDHRALIPFNQVENGPQLCEHGPWEFIPDGYLDEDGFFYVGGAWSIDGAARAADEDNCKEFGYEYFDKWMPGLEEVSSRQIPQILDFARQNKDKIKYLVTHDCAFSDLSMLLSSKFIRHSCTGRFIDDLFNIIEPDIHYFGHHHKRMNFRSRMGCQKKLLNMLPYSYSGLYPPSGKMGWFDILEIP